MKIKKDAWGNKVAIVFYKEEWESAQKARPITYRKIQWVLDRGIVYGALMWNGSRWV